MHDRITWPKFALRDHVGPAVELKADSKRSPMRPSIRMLLLDMQDYMRSPIHPCVLPEPGDDQVHNASRHATEVIKQGLGDNVMPLLHAELEAQGV